MSDSNDHPKEWDKPQYAPTATDNYEPSDDYEANWTDYRYIKQGWDNSKNFTTSYGEKPTPKGFQEATRILGSMREDHPGSKAGRRYREETRKTEKEGVRPEVKSEVKSEAKPEIKPEVKQEKDSK